MDGWYSQGITVAYERARGVRALNQRCDGGFEVSVSKVLAGDTRAVIDAIANPRRRRQWAALASPAPVETLASALGAAKSKGFVVRPDGQARFR